MSFSKKTAFLGTMLGLALILSYVESLIPFYFGVPGMKLGLPNLCIILLLWRGDTKSAILVNIVRIILVSILFGNLFSMGFSLAGGILSFLVMLFSKKVLHLNLIVCSVLGGISHNLGQIILASIIVSNNHLYLYLPALFIAGFVTGAVIGVVADRVYIHLPKE